MRKRVVATTLLALPIGIAISLPVARVSSMHLRGNPDAREVVTKPARGIYDGAQLVIVGTLLVALAGVVRRSVESAPDVSTQTRPSPGRPHGPVARSTTAHDVAV